MFVLYNILIAKRVSPLSVVIAGVGVACGSRTVAVLRCARAVTVTCSFVEPPEVTTGVCRRGWPPVLVTHLHITYHGKITRTDSDHRCIDALTALSDY